MAKKQASIQFTVTRINALVDGGTVTAQLSRGDVIHFTWGGTVSRSARSVAEQRLAVMIRRFTTVTSNDARQLTLLP